MALFDNTLLDLYKSDSNIKKMLNGCELMNLETFMTWYLPPEEERRRSIRLQQNSDYKTADIILTETEKKKMYNRSMGILKDLATAVCGKDAIGEIYGKRSILNAVSNPEFDFLVAVDMAQPQSNPKQRLYSVVAFLAAEKGECFESTPGIDRSKVFSVNLICCKKNDIHSVKMIKTVKSVVLLGAYMYCIKNNGNVKMDDKIGILELAGAYKNLSGFFSYTKVGFDKDNSLYGDYCFPDANNLAMSVDINKYTNDDIIGMVTGVIKRDPKKIKDNTGIYELGLPGDDDLSAVAKQKLIAKISSLKHMMDLNYHEVQNTHHLKAFKDSIVKKMNYSTSLSPVEETKAVQDYLEDEKTEYKKMVKKRPCGSESSANNIFSSCAISGGRSRRRRATQKRKHGRNKKSKKSRKYS